jgi:hypothetical protein
VTRSVSVGALFMLVRGQSMSGGMARCSRPCRAARATRGRVFCKLLYVFKQLRESKTLHVAAPKSPESTLDPFFVHRQCSSPLCSGSSSERAVIGVCYKNKNWDWNTAKAIVQISE